MRDAPYHTIFGATTLLLLNCPTAHVAAMPTPPDQLYLYLFPSALPTAHHHLDTFFATTCQTTVIHDTAFALCLPDITNVCVILPVFFQHCCCPVITVRCIVMLYVLPVNYSIYQTTFITLLYIYLYSCQHDVLRTTRCCAFTVRPFYHFGDVGDVASLRFCSLDSVAFLRDLRCCITPLWHCFIVPSIACWLYQLFLVFLPHLALPTTFHQLVVCRCCLHCCLRCCCHIWPLFLNLVLRIPPFALPCTFRVIVPFLLLLHPVVTDVVTNL